MPFFLRNVSLFRASCLAVMFAKLGMSVKDAFEEFNKICNEVYLVNMKPERSGPQNSPRPEPRAAYST